VDAARGIVGATHASASVGASCAFRLIEARAGRRRHEEAWGVRLTIGHRASIGITSLLGSNRGGVIIDQSGKNKEE